MSFDLIPYLKGPYYGHGLGICCRFSQKSLKTLKKPQCFSSSEVGSENMKVSIQRFKKKNICAVIGYILKATYIQNDSRRTHVAIISLIALKHKLQFSVCRSSR